MPYIPRAIERAHALCYIERSMYGYKVARQYTADAETDVCRDVASKGRDG